MPTFPSQAGAICRDYRAHVSGVHDPEEGLRLSRELVARLRELDPPARLSARFTAALADMDRLNALAARIVRRPRHARARGWTAVAAPGA